MLAGRPLPPSALDGEDALPDLDLLPPPPPPPAYPPPPNDNDDDDEVPPAPMGASLISDLEQLHLPPPPPPPQVLWTIFNPLPLIIGATEEVGGTPGQGKSWV